MKLMDLYIQFGEEGADKLRNAMKEMKDETDKLVAGYQKLNQAYATIGNTAKVAFAAAAASLTGFVRAGLSQTAEGEQLSYAMTELSQEIASVFIPVIEDATDLVRGLTDWFRGLSGEQQDSILHWIEFAAGLGLAIVVIPKVIVVIGALATAFKGLAVAIGLSTGGLGLLLAGLALVGVGVAAYLGAFDSAEQGAKNKEPHRRVTRSGGGMEDVVSTYKRLQQAALKTDIPRQHLAVAQDQLAAERQMVELLQRGTPVVVQ